MTVCQERASVDTQCLEERRSQLRQTLISVIADAIAIRGLTQVQAATICGTDQPMLSKVLSGRKSSVTADKLLEWLMALGCSMELRIAAVDMSRPGELVITREMDAQTLSEEL